MILFKIGFLTVTLVDAVDLLLVSWIFYTVYQYFKGTRAGQMLVGLIILLIASFIFNAFGLRATSWLVNRFQTVWVVAFVILCLRYIVPVFLKVSWLIWSLLYFQ